MRWQENWSAWNTCDSAWKAEWGNNIWLIQDLEEAWYQSGNQDSLTHYDSSPQGGNNETFYWLLWAIHTPSPLLVCCFVTTHTLKRSTLDTSKVFLMNPNFVNVSGFILLFVRPWICDCFKLRAVWKQLAESCLFLYCFVLFSKMSLFWLLLQPPLCFSTFQKKCLFCRRGD